MYNNRLITSAEVIEELLDLSKEMTEAYKAGDEKGLSTEELAFYDALAADPQVLRKMKDKVLVEMAQELTELIRRNRTVDWDKKESARAYMRTQVKHLLRKYKYPPEKARGAVDIVIKQWVIRTIWRENQMMEMVVWQNSRKLCSGNRGTIVSAVPF